jgi:hypothetical protein
MSLWLWKSCERNLRRQNEVVEISIGLITIVYGTIESLVHATEEGPLRIVLLNLWFRCDDSGSSRRSAFAMTKVEVTAAEADWDSDGDGATVVAFDSDGAVAFLEYIET